ncbi:hypothetical protein EMPS_07434 [Entomortierella parvispora]|uniref:Cytochrome P450 n=1 Tax=Entomortierella parvispora TaxID=205924 RepID=A0A9P3HEF2_9FUNG|nr:hypothetical protein EMPS_07434 [Entomortierella parvispora]
MPSSNILSTTKSSSSVVLQLIHVLSTLFRVSKPVLLATLLYTLFKYRHTAYGTTPRTDIPGPAGLPLLGNLIEMVRRPKQLNYQTQTKYHGIYGQIYAMTLPGIGRVINVTHPESLDHVLRVNFWAYEKGEYFRHILGPLIGSGIFGADGQHWKWQRRLASHIFNVAAFRNYTSDVFCQEGQLVLDYLCTVADRAGDQNIVDLQSIFYMYTLDSFGEIAFGQSFGCLKDPEQEVEFATAFDRLNTTLANRFNAPMWPLTDRWNGLLEQVEKDQKTIFDFAYSVIRKRRAFQQQKLENQEKKKNGEPGQSPSGTKREKKDLMQLFMDAHDENGEPLSDEMMRDTLLNFVLAGRDTTAQALSWMFYLIHRSQSSGDILRKLTEETDRILGRGAQSLSKGDGSPTSTSTSEPTIQTYPRYPTVGLPTYETTKNQKYAEACFYEALRLYPSVPQNIKICVEDDVLPSGHKVYKGEKIGWSSWAMGRDTKIWGPDASVYRPERWLTGEKASSSKFVSFHLGPRTCLGQQFATIEAITIMSMLFQKFTFELVDPDNEPSYGPALTLPMDKGLPIRVRRRLDPIV